MKNELIHETSPYLLQHAHNPVHWQPWSAAALKLAEEQDKPVLVSIGYSACHWCHVMERESFENEATAAIMNKHFINIKIDREERPDLDHIYMDAVQAMSGSGGWPLNVFLTPEGKPFYGGTYFPPVKAYNRASWSDVLMSVNDAWQNRRDEMLLQAETLIAHIQKSNNFAPVKAVINLETGTAPFTKEDCRAIADSLLATADKTEGGFGHAPKFPQTFSINCLLQAALFLKDEHALQHAELSLTKMINGGIYDQLAGGLARYSTDNKWLAPHFEKMLYDNALFIIALGNAYLLTKKEIYRTAIRSTCAFIFSEMKNSEGGYYAALDADSEGVEGKFYVWDKTETDAILGADAALFNAYYDVTAQGNWEEKNILRVLRPLKEVAAELNITESDAETIISNAKKKVLKERNKRVRPGTDDKILLGWNALLVTAFCKAYAALQEEEYRAAATELFAFLETKLKAADGTYFHTYKNGQAKYPAFADDYACLAEACLQLQEITADEAYLYRAIEIVSVVMENFEDTESGYFFFTGKAQDDIAVRKIELYDGAAPSANSVMAKALLYLSHVFDNREWRQRAVEMIVSLKNIILKYPGSFGIWASAAMDLAAGINEISVIGTGMMPLLEEVLLQYIPNKVLQGADSSSELPLLKEKYFLEKPAIYLCRHQVCKAPVSTAETLFQETELNRFNN